MSDPELDEFLRGSRTAYIEELVASGMADEAAATLADEQQHAAFPDGRPAHGHCVCRIVEDDRPVGYVWFGPETATVEDQWWLWDIEVDATHRGRGVGTEAIALVEAEVRRLGGTGIGLSVFGANDSARRLYDRLGFATVSVRMHKRL